MKILYYIPAFGNNNINIKYDILDYNISYIYNQIKSPFDLCINFYTPSPNVIKSIEENKCINKLLVYEKNGVLTELFLTNPHNAGVNEYDYIFFILDDEKITNMEFMKMIEIKQKYNFELLSPKIIKSTHRFMNLLPRGVSVNNFLEVYFLLLTPKDFTRFLSIHTINNKWMWGADFLFGYYNIKAGVAYSFEAEHVLPSNSNDGEAERCMNIYLKEKTPFKSLNDITKKYKPIELIYIDTPLKS